MCLHVFLSCFGTVDKNNCGEALDSTADIVVAHVRAEGGEASAVFVLGETWCDMTVPVIRDFWSVHVLVTSMVFLLWKHGRGKNVGLRVSNWGENLMLRRWMHGFGIVYTVLWFDELVECGGAKSMKRVSFGMFGWALRYGIMGEADLCTNLGRVGALLY